MDKAYIEQAALEYALSINDMGEQNTFEFEVSQQDFKAGVEWLLSVQEEIKATETK